MFKPSEREWSLLFCRLDKSWCYVTDEDFASMRKEEIKKKKKKIHLKKKQLKNAKPRKHHSTVCVI